MSNTENYRGYELRYYPKCDKHPEHDNKFVTFKARPYDDAEYYWAYTYDAKHWFVVYNGKFVDKNFIGGFMEVIDFIEKQNKNIEQKIIHL